MWAVKNRKRILVIGIQFVYSICFCQFYNYLKHALCNDWPKIILMRMECSDNASAITERKRMWPRLPVTINFRRVEIGAKTVAGARGFGGKPPRREF